MMPGDLERVLELAEAQLAGMTIPTTAADYDAYERVRDAHLAETLSH